VGGTPHPSLADWERGAENTADRKLGEGLTLRTQLHYTGELRVKKARRVKEFMRRVHNI